GDYMAVLLSDVGTTNRIMDIEVLDADTLATVVSVLSFEPSVAFEPAGIVVMAEDNQQDPAVVGATGGVAGEEAVLVVFYDVQGDSLKSQITVGTGTAPRVECHIGEDHFVVAWPAGADVRAAVYDWNGTAIGTDQTVFSGAPLKGLATPGSLAVDEALI